MIITTPARSRSSSPYQRPSRHESRAAPRPFSKQGEPTTKTLSSSAIGSTKTSTDVRRRTSSRLARRVVSQHELHEPVQAMQCQVQSPEWSISSPSDTPQLASFDCARRMLPQELQFMLSANENTARYARLSSTSSSANVQAGAFCLLATSESSSLAHDAHSNSHLALEPRLPIDLLVHLWNIVERNLAWSRSTIDALLREPGRRLSLGGVVAQLAAFAFGWGKTLLDLHLALMVDWVDGKPRTRLLEVSSSKLGGYFAEAAEWVALLQKLEVEGTALRFAVQPLQNVAASFGPHFMPTFARLSIDHRQHLLRALAATSAEADFANRAAKFPRQSLFPQYPQSPPLSCAGSECGRGADVMVEDALKDITS